MEIETELLTNRGREARNVLEEEFSKCEFARLAVAFVSRPGVKFLAAALKACQERKAPVRVIAGEDFCLTDPDALGDLRDMGAQVKLYCCSGKGVFHPKLYLFARGKRASLLVGSNNLTSEAFANNVEAGVIMKGDVGGSVMESAGTFFADLWNGERAIPATASYLQRYRAGYERAKKARAYGAEALQVAEPEVADAPERKPGSRPLIREMCQQVMAVGEELHTSDIVDRVLYRFPEWEHGLTPDASIRRDLMQFSTHHQKVAGEAMFGWNEAKPGYFVRLR